MRKKICVILLVMVMVLSLATIQVQASSFTTELTPDSTEVYKSGDTVVVTVSVADLDVGDSGINAFSAYLSYDTDVFEPLTSSSVEGLNSWSATYSTETGQIALTKNSFVNSEEDIMEITLITKSGLDDGTTGDITLSNIQASNSEEDIDSSSVSITIEIGTKTTITVSTSSSNTTNETEDNTTTNNTTNDTEETNTVTTITTTDTSNTNTNTNTSDDDTDIPYTGTNSNNLIKIIIGFTIIACVLFIKIKKMKDIK